ncbi:MAG: HAMP domain-containing histidine kinase [Hyphomonadaceae bacterium]|nr:HAMP domain-containing histidine kinase [Hyphomonadaceae bacterium]
MTAETSSSHPTAGGGGPGWQHSLSVRLFWLTMAMILLVELIVFIPSATAFRANWLEEKAQAARIASLAVEASPSRDLSMELSDSLLESAGVLALTELDDSMRIRLLPAAGPIPQPVIPIDLRQESYMSSVSATAGTFFAPQGRSLMIIDHGARQGRVIEVIVSEAPLKGALWAYGGRILLLSLLISLAAGGLVFAVLFALVVRPMRRVTRSVEQFRQDPGDWTGHLSPTTRRDEIGRAQNALADMESAVSESFRQRERLAELGEAVARINHDLRGSLAAAQLVSEGLARSEDPRVKRAAPRLERALERAITLATQTLQYGKTSAPKADLHPCALAMILDEAAEEVLAGKPGITWQNQVDARLTVQADGDHLHRIAANLIRNAAEAMGESGEIRVELEDRILRVCDTGSGLPEEIIETLFKPFGSAGKRGGTGLGLAIARDLARAMGAELRLGETGADGTAFELEFAEVPDWSGEAAAQ